MRRTSLPYKNEFTPQVQMIVIEYDMRTTNSGKQKIDRQIIRKKCDWLLKTHSANHR